MHPITYSDYPLRPITTDPKRFGLGSIRHERSYDLIFSEAFLNCSGFDLDRYCYIYEHPFEPSPRLARAYLEIEAHCDAWSAAYSDRDVDLLYDIDEAGGLLVHDSRELPAKIHKLDANEAKVLMAAEIPCTIASLKKELLDISESSFELSLKRLDELGLVFQDDGKVLSLALNRSTVAPRRHWWDNHQTRWQLQDVA